MARFLSFVISLTVLLATQSTAHFSISHPITCNTPDCVQYDLASQRSSNFYARGGYIHIVSNDTTATWLFRVTFNQAEPNWTNLLPVVAQKGLNDFCEPDIVVPASWANRKGVIQIVQISTDGIVAQVSVSLICTTFNSFVISGFTFSMLNTDVYLCSGR